MAQKDSISINQLNRLRSFKDLYSSYDKKQVELTGEKITKVDEFVRGTLFNNYLTFVDSPVYEERTSNQTSTISELEYVLDDIADDNDDIDGNDSIDKKDAWTRLEFFESNVSIVMKMMEIKYNEERFFLITFTTQGKKGQAARKEVLDYTFLFKKSRY